jgi:PLP dependent protein
MIRETGWKDLVKELEAHRVQLVAVSKTKPVADIQALYDLGQRDFGENYVQELVDKQAQLPEDIHWHYIGHLQTNKVKFIAPFVHLIHGVDSFRLLLEIQKQAQRNNRVLDVLLQVHISGEGSKFGMSISETYEFMDYVEAQNAQLQNIRIRGVMGMASFTEEEARIREEFKTLFTRFDNLSRSNFLGVDYFDICSMGMSADYKIAIEEGSTMVRIGSALFGER